MEDHPAASRRRRGSRLAMKKYPRAEQFGLTIDRTHPGIAGIHSEELREKLGDRIEEFSELFGIQTCGENGLYVYDVEAVLERMESGKLTGTQLYWD